MKPSLRTFFSRLEYATLGLALIFVVVLFLLLWNDIMKDYLKKQKIHLDTVDNLFTVFLDEKRSLFQLFAESEEREKVLPLMAGFNDIYRVNPDFVVEDVYLRSQKRLFSGFDLTNSDIGKFLHRSRVIVTRYSPLYHSPLTDELSIFITSPEKGGWLVGRIGLDYIGTVLEGIARRAGIGILIITGDGFIIKSTLHPLSFQIVENRRMQTIKNFDDTYFLFRKKSEILKNDIVILTPFPVVYTLIISIGTYAFLFILAIIVLLLVKIRLQRRYLIKPMQDLAGTISAWNPRKSGKNLYEESGSYEEINSLYRTFGQMTDRISNMVDELRNKGTLLSNERERLMVTLQSIADAVIAADSRNLITVMNSGAEKLTGWRVHEAEGKNIEQLFKVFDGERELPFTVPFSPEPTAEGVPAYVFKSKRGDEIQVAVRVSSILDKDGKGVGSVTIIRNVTNELKTEERLRQAQKMETVGNLAGGLAHDFNNMLGGITGTLSLLKYHVREKGEVSVKNLESYIQTMESSAERAADMVARLISISRKQAIKREPFNLNRLILHLKEVCSNSFDKSIELEFTPYSEPAVINGDESRIEQVVLNLAINGAHAMTIMRKQGEEIGGRLSISVEKIPADLAFTHIYPEATAESYYLIRVKDTGVGMTPEVKSRIFDPFFSTKKKGAGTGLGLSMVYSTIRQHHGHINVYSEVGKGSSFHIYLPVLENVSISEKRKSEAVDIRGSGTVLVIDDEEVMRQTAGEILKECGYIVHTAHDGKSGIKMYREFRREIDLVLLDMAMPGMSGKETYAVLKNINPDIRVIIASGFRLDSRVEESLRMGVNCFIQKPYTLEDLATGVKQVIETGKCGE